MLVLFLKKICGRPVSGKALAAGKLRNEPAASALPLTVLFLLATFSLLLTGCQKRYVDQPELVEIHGTILLDDQPVANTKVVFVPDGNYIGSKWSLAYGVTNQDGEFQMKLRNGSQGVYSGWHRIYLSHIERNEVTEGELDLSPSGLDVGDTDGEAYPFFYNQESELRFEAKKGRGILRPKFELSTIDPVLLESK